MKKTIAIITIIVGVIVMILGLSIQTHDVSSYYITGASFGADFYTYVYDGIDTIVDELDEINKGIEAIASAGKMIVISIGLLIAVMGLKQLSGDPITVNVSQPALVTPSAPVAPVSVVKNDWVCTCGSRHLDSNICSCGKTKEEVLRGETSVNCEEASD